MEPKHDEQTTRRILWEVLMPALAGAGIRGTDAFLMMRNANDLLWKQGRDMFGAPEED